MSTFSIIYSGYYPAPKRVSDAVHAVLVKHGHAESEVEPIWNDLVTALSKEAQPAEPPEGSGFKCTFCGNHCPEHKIIHGPSVWICDNCVALCNEIIEERRTTAYSNMQRAIGELLLSAVDDTHNPIDIQQAALLARAVVDAVAQDRVPHLQFDPEPKK